MIKSALAWLTNVPAQDPVDRSNAFFMQFFFAFYGLMQPLNKLYIIEHANIHLLVLAQSHQLRNTNIPFIVDLATDVAMSVSAWMGFWLIRRGLFRQAVKQFLAVVIASAVLFFAVTGVPDTRDDSIFFVGMIVAALMLGRRALWSMYGGVLLAYFAGMTSETLHPPPLPQILLGMYAGMPGTMFSYFGVAIVLDRSVQSLRRNLDQINTQHSQLQQEIGEREKAQERLLHSQKMDVVGRLASGVAHDLYNVLGVILGFSRARQKLDEPHEDIAPVAQELADALEGTEMAARRGAAVCRKLLNFSRQNVTLRETFDAAEALRELRPLLLQLVPPTIRLDIRTPSFALPIHFDRDQFELALLNLVTNARDAMPEGGACVIEATEQGDQWIELAIRDNGTGMAPGVAGRVFEPFYTTKPEGLGTGLGLSVVYELIGAAGGSIGIESVEGQGTSVRMKLPRSTMATSPVDNRDLSIRVWLIDDDQELRALLKNALEQGGCEVSEAASGAQAHRQMAAFATPPEVLVCDHRLPDTDGSTLLGQIRERYPQMPAILISSYLEGDMRDRRSELNDRFPKPFAPEALLARVQQMAQRATESITTQ